MDSPISKHDAEKTEYTIDFLETLIYEWIRRSIYFTTFSLTNFMLKTIAYKFKGILNVQCFEPSQEWVTKFRIKYNIHHVDTTKFEDIGYKCSKSTLPKDIFNELRDQFKSKSNDKFSEVIEIKDEIKEEIKEEIQNEVKQDEWFTQCVETDNYNENPNHGSTDTNTNQLLDIEDELPACTIFGWNSIENKSEVVTMEERSKSKLNIDNFTNITALNERSTDVANIRNTKIEELAGTEMKPVCIDQFIKNIDRFPTADRSKTKNTRCTKSKVKGKECFETNKNPTKKEKSKICVKQIKSGICDKPKLKCLQKTTITEIETKTTDLPPWISTTKPRPLLPPDVQIEPSLVLPGNMNGLCAVQKVITETPLESDKVVCTLNMPTSDQNSLTMPFMSQMPTNTQTPSLGQQPNIQPVFVHLHPPIVQVQVNEILSCSQMSPTLGNLQHTAPISQMPYLPSMNMTQQPPPANNFIQNQLTVQTTAMNNQQLITQATTNYFSTPPVQTIPEVYPNSKMASVVNFQDSIPTNIVIKATSDETTSSAYVTNSNITNLKISQVQSKGFASTAANTFINAPKQNTPNIPIVAQIPLQGVGKNVMCSRTSGNIGLPTPSTISPATKKIIPKPSTNQSPLSRIEAVNIGSLEQATTKDIENIFIPATRTSKKLYEFQTPAKFPEAQGIAARMVTPTTCSKQLPLSRTDALIPASTDEPLLKRIIKPSVLKNITITKTTSPKVVTSLTTQAFPSFTSQDQRLPILVKQKASSPNSVSKKLLCTKKIIESNSTSVKKPKMGSNTNEGTRFSKCKPLKTKEEVIKCIKLMEDFAMMNDNFRLIGFLERLEKQVNDF